MAPRKKKKTSKTTDKTSKTMKKKELETKKRKINESSSANQPSKVSKTESAKNVQKTKKAVDKKSLVPVMHTSAVDFDQIRYMPAFVDKTMIIKTVLDQEPRLLLIAPRRFGKTINMTMIKRFFEILPNTETQERNRKLFEGTKIEENCPEIVEKHFGKYPVLFLNFKSHGGISSITAARDLMARVVTVAYREHQYLRSSDKLEDFETEEVKKWYKRNVIEKRVNDDQEIYDALQNLCSYLEKHWSKNVIVLSDEYDSICTDAVLQIHDIKDGDPIPPERRHRSAENEIEAVINLANGSLSCLLKTDSNSVPIERGLLTGISYLMTQGLSKLSNVFECKFQEENRFSEFYGLSFDEVRKLLTDVPEISKNYEPSTFDELVEYYNGYRNNTLSVWSVMNYFNTGEKKSWWEKSGMASCLDGMLGISRIKDCINKLLSDIGYEIEIDYFSKIKLKHLCMLKKNIDNPVHSIQDVSLYFNILLEQGYLSIVKINQVGKEKKAILKIPNEEIKTEFIESLKLYFKDEYNLNFDLVVYCASIFDQFCTSDEENKKHLSELCERLNTLIQATVFNVKNEATLHHIIFLIIFNSKAKCFSEIRIIERNKKRLDLLMIFENIGIIIELKYDETAHNGLKQILEKQYFQAFKNEKYNPSNVKIEYFVLIGLNMSVDQKVTLNVLLNSLDIKKKCCFPEN